MNILKTIFRKAQTIKQSAGVVISAGLSAIWPTRDFYNFAKESYMKNVIAFRCIDIIAKSFIQAQWYMQSVSSMGDETELPNHPFNTILNRANIKESFSYLSYKTVSYLGMTGNVFLQKIGPSTGVNKGRVRELHVLRPDRMKIIINENGVVTAYEYTVGSNKTIFDVDPITGQSDILHIKLFNPVDDLWGMGATEPTAREIDTMNAMIEWNKALIDNSARPGMVLMTDGKLTDQQWERMRRDLREGHEGASNAGRSIILENAKDVKQYGYSPSEMDWIEGNRETARRIAFGFGVPPQLIGIPGDSTYSNYREARSAFWEDTVVFYLNMISAELNAWLFAGSEQLVYDIDEVPAMQYKRDLLWERAEKSTFLTVNERREMVGYEARPDGDVILVPSMTSTLDAITGDFMNEDDEEPVDDEDFAA